VRHYSKVSPDGNRYIYRAKILTGRYTQGFSSLKAPPPIDSDNPTIKYDSVVDNIYDPHEWVLFADNRKYPEYLIIFK
jgi:poly [ADP-ribose] polymerase 10/14/15